MRTAAHSYTEVGCFWNFVEGVGISGGPGPEALQQARVAANCLHILGVEPAMGRGFLP